MTDTLHRYHCRACGVISDSCLRSIHPFIANREVHYCAACLEAEQLVRACDVVGCSEPVVSQSVDAESWHTRCAEHR